MGAVAKTRHQLRQISQKTITETWEKNDREHPQKSSLSLVQPKSTKDRDPKVLY